MGRTDKFEQPEIDRVIEAERQPNHETPKAIGKIVLERTEVVQQGFDSMGTYIDGSW